jgi:hypothetical protein
MKAFISYSHQDAPLLESLHQHLASLRREGLLETWTDREIHPGEEIDASIEAAMQEAGLFLFLISPAFMASNYCIEKEFENALKLRKSGKAIVVPLILREVDWGIPALRQLKALPDDARPVISRHWHTQDEAFANISKGLRSLLVTYKNAEPKNPAKHKKQKTAKFTPGDLHVTAEEREKLREIHKEVVDRLIANKLHLSDAEIAKHRGKFSAIVWSQLNTHFETEDGLASLPKEKFEEAKSWLLQYRASKDKNFKKSDPQKYRNTLTKAIHTKKNVYNWSDEELYQFAAEKLQLATPVKSLNDLGTSQLELLKSRITYEGTKKQVTTAKRAAAKKPRILQPKLDTAREILDHILNHPVPEERGLTEILREAPNGPLYTCFIPNATARGAALAAKKTQFRPALSELISLGWLLQPEGNDNVRIYELNPNFQNHKL